MSQNKNNITYLPFCQSRQNLSMNNSHLVERADKSIFGQVIRLSLFGQNQNPNDDIHEANNATCVFELSRSFEKIFQTNSWVASEMAALSAKIVLNARKLGMKSTVKLAQDLGEFAMQGNCPEMEETKTQLLREVPKELKEVQI